MTVCSPSIAISKKDGQIKVCAKLPGMSKDDVRVELTQAGLIIPSSGPSHRLSARVWADLERVEALN
jgi:HSP20 family molecular chaperone IbpA